jgi:riboflavin synthase
VADVERSEDGVRLHIRTRLATEIAVGDSVATNGVCLTAVSVSHDLFVTEVMHETLALSSLTEVLTGSRLNLELAMRATDRLGGHIVQGHVDGVGTIERVLEDGFARRVTIAAPESVLRYVVYKGSITVNGVSLTVAALEASSFTVSLIPETLERTNLGAVAPGTIVNLEVDIVAKYVERLASASLASSAPAARELAL